MTGQRLFSPRWIMAISWAVYKLWKNIARPNRNQSGEKEEQYFQLVNGDPLPRCRIGMWCGVPPAPCPCRTAAVGQSPVAVRALAPGRVPAAVAGGMSTPQPAVAPVAGRWSHHCEAPPLRPQHRRTKGRVTCHPSSPAPSVDRGGHYLTSSQGSCVVGCEMRRRRRATDGARSVIGYGTAGITAGKEP